VSNNTAEDRKELCTIEEIMRSEIIEELIMNDGLKKEEAETLLKGNEASFREMIGKIWRVQEEFRDELGSIYFNQ